MGLLTNVEYKNNASTTLPDNADRLISESDVRGNFDNTADSYINRIDGLAIPDYDNATLYGIGDPVIYNRGIYRKINQANSGILPTDVSEWESDGDSVFSAGGNFGLSKPATEAEVTGGTNNTEYVTPLRLAEQLSRVGLSGYTDFSVIYATGGTLAEDVGEFTYNPATKRLGVQKQNSEANLHVGNSQGASILSILGNDVGGRAFTFYNSGHLAISNRLTSFTDPLPNKYRQYGKDYNGEDGKSSPYFRTEDGIEIGLRELYIKTGTFSGNLVTTTSLSGGAQIINVFEAFEDFEGIADTVTNSTLRLLEGIYVVYYSLTIGSTSDFSIVLTLDGTEIPNTTAFNNRQATGFSLPFMVDGTNVLRLVGNDIATGTPNIDSAKILIRKIG